MKKPSLETLKRSLKRALSAMLTGAVAAFVALPVNLEEPKKYGIVVAIALISGALLGLQKFLSGWSKYDNK